MEYKHIIEFDILRIVSCLIVVVLIHIPNNYGYMYYMDLTPYMGYLLHINGILVAMSSFVFLSGFSLYLNKANQKLNSRNKIRKFLKKRFLRVFPMYWVAVIVYFILFNDPSMTIFYWISHVLGLQIMFAPFIGEPIWTIWFVGIIVIYYLIFILLSYLDSYKKMILGALGVLFCFTILNIFGGLVEYRFFLYYNMFILGILAAKFYSSEKYQKIQESLSQKSKNWNIYISCITTAIAIPLYFLIAFLSHEYLNQEYGTYYINFILEINPGIFKIAFAFIQLNLMAILFIISVFAGLHLIIGILQKKVKKETIQKVFSPIAYSTFGVYLFHRPLIMLFSAILTALFDLDLYLKANLIIVLLFVPLIFVISFFLQKTMDNGIAFLSKRKKAEIQPIEIQTEAT